MRAFWRAVLRAAGEPVGTAVVLTTLALSLGAVTALLDLVNLIEWQPLPRTQAPRLVRVYTAHPQPFIGPWGYQPQADFEQYRDGTRTLHGVVGERLEELSVTTEGVERSQTVQFVSGDYFELLQVPSRRGRLLQSSDDQPTNAPVAVVSSNFWQARGRGAQDISQAQLLINDVMVRVVGIVPAGFTSLAGDGVAVWLPLSQGPKIVRDFADNNTRSTNVLAQLKRGVGRDQARAELQIIATELDRVRPLEIPREISVIPATITHPIDQGNFRPILRMLGLGAVLLVLLAASNVASVLLARTLGRRAEIELRQALGAPRSKLLALGLLDGTVLVFAGAALGLPVALATRRLFSLWDLETFAQQLRLDHRVLLAACAVAAATTLLVSGAALTAILRRSTHTPNLGRGATRSQTTFQFLAAAQIALSTVLMVATANLWLDLHTLSHADLGFNTEHLLYLQVDGGPLNLNGEETAQLTRRIEQRLVASPEVAGVGRSLFVPPIFLDISRQYRVLGEDEARAARLNFASRSYFEVMGLQLLEGRHFTPLHAGNDKDLRELVINQMVAEQLWPGRSAVGRRLEIIGSSRPGPTDYEIVGVVETSSQSELALGGEPILYFDIDQRPGTNRALAVRLRPSSQSVEERIAAIRSVLGGIAPGLESSRVRSAAQARHDALVVERLRSQSVALLASLGVLLSLIGVWGVATLLVTQRRREWALRAALGATPSSVTRAALRLATRMLLFGTALGGVASVWAVHAMQQQFGTLQAPAWLWLAVPAAMAGFGVLAVLLPARRASRQQPATVLRS